MVAENGARIRIMEFLARLLSINFTKTEEEKYNPELLEKIERGRAEYEAGKCTPLSPSDVWK